jgi:hypothetical protein
VRLSGICLFIVIVSGFSAPRCGATVYQSNGSEASVQSIHDNRARDGDTIVVPAGTFSWTSRLEITKGITLQGATTIVGPASNPTIIDATIIQDDTPRSGATGIIYALMSPGKSFRLTGITFAPGVSTQRPTGNGFIRFSSQGGNLTTSLRMDHCHFASLYQGRILWVTGWVYGVADHNVIEAFGSTTPFLIAHPSWGGPGQINGNGSWADYPWYGTEKFFFIEDNTITRPKIVFAGIDSDNGGRYVARHNYFHNYVPGGHGTEGGAPRGQRASEVYNNTIHMTVAGKGGQRSGSSLWHDNIFTGVEPTNNIVCPLANFRETSTRPNPVWGIADGTSPWDVNDTEGNGTYVEGHPPYLFESGSATSGSTITGEAATFSDSTKNWTPNQWVGYSVKGTNPASPSYRLGSYIISNTSNTITYAYNNTPSGGHLIFNPGDTYEIHRVLVMMDQNGRGKGDQVAGATKPINAATGTPFWPHQALEPCYSWNNIYTPNGHAMGYGVRPGQPTTKEDIDFFNLGAGFSADTTPSQVSSRYTAALNGVDYVGTFVYPHPLVSGNQPPPSATPTSARHLQKGKKTKKKKRRAKTPRITWVNAVLLPLASPL